MMTGEPNGTAEGIEPGEQARAHVYRLLGALLASAPGPAMLGMLRDIRLQESPDGDAMNAAWAALRAAAEQADPARLEEEFFSLFIGLGRGEVVPYASFYIHGFLMEKVLASLRGELAGLGYDTGKVDGDEVVQLVVIVDADQCAVFQGRAQRGI